MPLQNRVAPDGEIIAAPWRGGMMGNRGCLHDEESQLGRARWRHRNWVCCVTEFRGRHRLPMPPPGSPTVYTALFFWDEATAYSAGHRPCGECRNAEYRRFKALWGEVGLGENSAQGIDRVLHAARLPRLKGLAPGEMAEADALPDGTVVRGPGIGLIWEGAFHPWQASGGYGAPQTLPDQPVEVLTPAPILTLFEAGLVPMVRLSPPA